MTTLVPLYIRYTAARPNRHLKFYAVKKLLCDAKLPLGTTLMHLFHQSLVLPPTIQHLSARGGNHMEQRYVHKGMY